MTHPVYPIIHPNPSTRPRSIVVADCDLNEMAESEQPLGPQMVSVSVRETKMEQSKNT